MKIADDFLKVCLNYDNEIQTILKEWKETDPVKYEYYGKDAAHRELKNRVFILEEKDFNTAILLCKEYKRSIQKKAYELKLKQFKETGAYKTEYRNEGWRHRFIDDLRGELQGRRNTYDKRMLVNASLKEFFPETKEIYNASYLFDLCEQTKKYEMSFERAQQALLNQQSKINKIHDLEEEGKSVVEIVGVLKEMEED